MKKLITIFLLFLLNQSTVLAYDSYNVHPKINEKASRQAENLSSALRDIGFLKGVDSVVNGKKIYLWFREGGTKEDLPIYRANNHFHDPLKPWSSAGLKGSMLGLSSLVWAQDQTLLGPSAGGDWSWKKARTLYYDALTSEDTNVREQIYADTFKSLGHVMHLMADSSVPAHVRNDIHIFPLTIPRLDMEVGEQTYESWARRNYQKLNYAGLILDQAIFSQGVSDSSGLVPISALWDQDKYTGSNPEVVLGTSIGLAEYANADFFSEDTIFKDYPHPAYSDTNYPNIDWSHPETVDAEDGKLDNRIYIRRTVGESNTRLASLSYISYDCIKKGYYQLSPLVLDDNVYKDYASLLIPRAVGYSAALLDYFFRGSMELSLPAAGSYAETSSDQDFTKLTVLAQNTTSTGENMDDGSIELVVIYRLAYDDPFRNYPESYDFKAAGEYSYIVVPEANNERSIPRDKPVELTFDLSGNPIPLYAIDVNLQLVYHGRLGMEDDAVVVALKDISEPTPIDIMNDMDLTCLNGNFYTSGSQDAIGQVDSNHDGIPEWDIYPHDLVNVYLRMSSAAEPAYASPASYDFTLPNLNPGGFTRAFYVLTDNNFNYSFNQSWANSDPMDPWIPQPLPAALYQGTAITNQTYYVDDTSACAPDPAPCYIWKYPNFLTYRNYDLWWGSGVIFNNNAYPAGAECSCYTGILRTCPTEALLSPASMRVLSSPNVTTTKSKSASIRRQSSYKGINLITSPVGH